MTKSTLKDLSYEINRYICIEFIMHDKRKYDGTEIVN